MRRGLVLLTGLTGLAQVSSALGPHQVALIVNEASSRSMTLANHYASLRNIPLENRIHVRLPPAVLQAEAELSASEFDETVLKPVQQKLRDREIHHQVLAWVYSGDFPVRIRGSSPASLMGYTLVQGQLPEAALIQQGKAPSRFFAGIPGVGADPVPGFPFLAYRQTLGEDMPVPSMLLAHLGARGLTVDQAVEVIRRGVQAENSRPGGTVFFEGGKDVRVRTREFQFPAALEVLNDEKIKAKVVEGLPDRKAQVLGVLAGRTQVYVPACGTFLPGAYADHLTSFSAMFSQYHQTKCTEWLRYGATGTSGAVVEPMSIWTKFPSARLFEFYGRGFTLIESLFASTASPFQILFMGEPLSAPFNQRLNLALLPVSGDTLQGVADLRGHCLFTSIDSRQLLWRLSIDGKPQGQLSRDPSFRVDTTTLSDGYHAFGVEAYQYDNPLRMGFSRSMMKVSNLGRQMDLLSVPDMHDSSRPLPVQLKADPAAQSVGVEVNGVLVAEEKINAATLTLPPDRWGEGPVALQGVATYPDGMRVRSQIHNVRLEKLNQSPSVQVSRELLSGEHVQWKARADDPEGDAVTVEWFGQLLHEAFSPTQVVDYAYLERMPEDAKAAAAGILSRLSQSPSIVEARMRPQSSGGGVAGGNRFGLVYDYIGKGNFSFFGYGGESGSWVAARVRDGHWSTLRSWGRPVFREEEYELRLEQTAPDRILARVNGEEVFEDLQSEMGPGTCGVYAEHTAYATSIRVNLNACKGAEIDEEKWTATWSPKELHESFESIELKVIDEWGAASVLPIEL